MLIIKINHRYPYNSNEKLVCEIGEQIINDISKSGFSITNSWETDSIIEGEYVPIESLTREQVIECMQSYLTTIDKTLDGWLQETHYELYWHERISCVETSEFLIEKGLSVDFPGVEPLLGNGANDNESRAESSTEETETQDEEVQFVLAFMDMLANEIYQKASCFYESSENEDETFASEWFSFSEFAHVLYLDEEEEKEAFANLLDERLGLICSLELDREKGFLGMEIKEEDKNKIIFHVRRLP